MYLFGGDGVVDGSDPVGQRFFPLYLSSLESGTLSKLVSQGPSTVSPLPPERNPSQLLQVGDLLSVSINYGESLYSQIA